MAVFYQNVNAPVTTLANPLGQGSVIRFVSTSIDKKVGKPFDNTSFNLHLGDRIIFVFSLRFTENRIIFNTKTEQGSWGTDQAISTAGVFKDSGATIGIRANDQSYTISVDGNDIYIYQKRVRADANGVSYTVSANTTSSFSNPVAVIVSSA